MGRTLAAVGLAGAIVVGVASAVGTRATTAPSNTSTPTISGSTSTGSTLTAGTGSWSGSTPINFQYRWMVCGQQGQACHDIDGATSQTYQLKPGDAGNTIRVRVTATNADGTSSVLSAPTAGIAPSGNRPANTKLPWIQGSMAAGSTLTAMNGDWSGTSPDTYTYQWQICDGNGNACHDIGGASAQTYQLKSGDAGNTLKVQVTAHNPVGTASATSEHSAKIGAASPGAGCPALAAGAGSVPVANVNAPARLQVTSFFSTPRVISGAFSSFQLQVHVTDTCGQSVQGARVYATAVPYNQVTIPAQTMTDGSGNTTLEFNRKQGFPAAKNQRAMVMFVRATRPGDNTLAGISTRRLISLHVNLRAET